MVGESKTSVCVAQEMTYTDEEFVAQVHVRKGDLSLVARDLRLPLEVIITHYEYLRLEGVQWESLPH